MSEQNKIVTKNLVKMKSPIIIKKNIAILRNRDSKNMLMEIKSKLKPLFRDDVIYETCDTEFLQGKYRKLVLVNRLNILSNGCRTIAKYYSETMLIDEKSSDQVTQLIGQKNYDIVFSTLLSVIDQKQKIKAILALLNGSKKVEVACQTQFSDKLVDRTVVLSDQSSQTDETSMEIFKRYKLKRQRMKRQKVPYVVKDSDSESITKTDKYPKWSMDIAKKSDEVKLEVLVKSEELPEMLHCDKPFPAIDEFNDENSMESRSNLSFTNISITSEALDVVIKDVIMKSDFVNFDPNVKDKEIDIKNENIIVKQEDIFHIATPEKLSTVSPEEKHKLIRTQQYIDAKYFLTRMENDNLVIHHAVLTDDVHLLKRHCLLLKKMQGTVDFTNASNLTPLQMSILQNCQAVCTKVLLEHGADPMFCDEDDRTILHLAAEGNPDKLKVIIEHCTSRARLILQEDEDLWRDEFQIKSDQQLALYLLRYMCQQCDSQGYTPLMVASRLGKFENVSLLVQAAPTTVNQQSASNGDTALYIAVVAATIDAINSLNKSKVSEHYTKTIEILLENGARPSIYNNSGSNIHSMLQDSYVPELSLLIANKMMSNHCLSRQQSVCPVSEPYMLLKDIDGNVQIRTLKRRKNKLHVGDKILSDSAENSTRMQEPDVINVASQKPDIIEQKPDIIEQKPDINEQKPGVTDTNTSEFVENPATKTRIVKPKPIILENVKFTNNSRILPKIKIMSDGTITLKNTSPTKSITDKPSNIVLKSTEKLTNAIKLNTKEPKRKVQIDPLDISISTPSTSKIKKT